MSRRPMMVSMAALGASVAMAASMSIPVFAQEAAPALTADITSYPNYGGGVDCENATFNGSPYAGNLKSIDAPDANTVVFTFCNPNVAFLSQVAFAALQIDDAQYLIDHMADGSILETPNGTGPYKLDTWDRGNRMTFVANDGYWGEKALTPNLEFRWSDQSAQRLVELQSGTVDGIDNPGKDDMPAIDGDTALTLYPREGLNTFYVGMNHTMEPWTDVKVRQAIAMGIDRQRIVDNFYPAGSEVASHFTPCSIPNGCAGESWYEFDVEAARALLEEAGLGDGFETTITYRDVVRGYLPDPNIVAQDIQAQLLENLNITAEIVVMESGAFLEAADAGTIEGLHLLGWGADYPDMTNFLDYHFGAGSSAQFGDQFDELTTVLAEAASLASDDDRAPLYEQANNLIRDLVPMVPVAHGGSGVAYLASVTDAHVSPLGNESFARMNPGKDTFVWMQNAEPISLYCADETDGESLRACEQTTEALLAYEVGGTAVEPSLATACTPNEDLTVWTCTLREGVTFHDGSALDANDVVMSYVVQWDASHPPHVGNTGAFSYFSALWGGFLNAPPAEG